MKLCKNKLNKQLQSYSSLCNCECKAIVCITIYPDRFVTPIFAPLRSSKSSLVCKLYHLDQMLTPIFAPLRIPKSQLVSGRPFDILVIILIFQSLHNIK